MEEQEKIVHEEETSSSGGKQPDRFLPISIMVAAALIGGALIFSTIYKGGSVADPNNPSAAGGAAAGGAQAAAAAASIADLMKLGPRDAVLGSPTAPVTLIEYGDYQCPFCTKFFAETEPLIVSNYVQSGKVKMVFRDFAFLGPESTDAANAAECANDQGKLWAYHDALYGGKYKDEQRGGGENNGYFTRALFLQLGQQVGLDAKSFTTCLDTAKNASIAAEERSSAAAAGLNSTPAFLINGTQILGAQPYSQFKAAIEAALVAAKK